MNKPTPSPDGTPLALCVFCGAQNDVDPIHLSVGKEFGMLLAGAGHNMVFGGGDCGMMGAVANAAMGSGAHVTGVFPEHLEDMEKPHREISQTIIVGSMHERKKLMFDLSDAFIILPGGFGTMDEMFEILTWRQIGLHNKPVIIFNHRGYWTPLIKMMDHIINEGFAQPVNRDYFEVVDNLESLMRAISSASEKKDALTA